MGIIPKAPNHIAFTRNSNLRKIVGGRLIKNCKLQKFPLEQVIYLIFIDGKNSILQPNDNNKPTHESTDKANI